MPVLLVLALMLRMAFSLLVVGWHAPVRGDEIDYVALAGNLAVGAGFTLEGGYETARRPPVYPVFLAGLTRLTGRPVAAGRIAQWLLGTLAVYLTFAVTRKYFTERAAWIAAWLTAVNPFLIFISGYILTENLYLVLLLAFLICLPRREDLAGRFQRSATGAGLLALMSLTRPTGCPYALWVAAGFLTLGTPSISRRLSRFLILAMIWLVPFVPWVLRNQAVFGKPILFTTHGGRTFYQGNNAVVRDTPRYYGGVSPLHLLPERERLQGLGEVEENDETWRLGLAFVRENKKDVPAMVGRKFIRFWRMTSDMGLSGIKSGWWWGRDSRLARLASSLDVGFLYAVIVFPFFLVGLVWTLLATVFNRRQEGGGPLLARPPAGTWTARLFLFHPYGVIVVHTSVALVFFGSLRSRVPVEPVIAAFAAAGLLGCLNAFHARWPRRS
jgi:4-amino-4-deoxy-L-arabinose transferase-like glycosyltransferase